jgi:hypothetical protein
MLTPPRHVSVSLQLKSTKEDKIRCPSITVLPIAGDSYDAGRRCPPSLHEQRHTGAVIQNRSPGSILLMKFCVSPVCVRQPHLFFCSSRGHTNCQRVKHLCCVLIAYFNVFSESSTSHNPPRPPPLEI